MEPKFILSAQRRAVGGFKEVIHRPRRLEKDRGAMALRFVLSLLLNRRDIEVVADRPPSVVSDGFRLSKIEISRT